jgi:hypothetical protein
MGRRPRRPDAGYGRLVRALNTTRLIPSVTTRGPHTEPKTHGSRPHDPYRRPAPDCLRMVDIYGVFGESCGWFSRRLHPGTVETREERTPTKRTDTNGDGTVRSSPFPPSVFVFISVMARLSGVSSDDTFSSYIASMSRQQGSILPTPIREDPIHGIQPHYTGSAAPVGRFKECSLRSRLVDSSQAGLGR